MKTNAKIIYAFPASGKSTLAKRNSSFLDLTTSEYKWLNIDKHEEKNREKLKGVLKEENPLWPENYFKAIEREIDNYDYILIAYPGIEFCKKNKLNYISCFPTLSQKNDYLKRMKNRENNRDFIKKFLRNMKNL